MLEKLLHLKHWQLFLLLLGPVVAAQITMGVFFSMSKTGDDLRAMFYIFPVFILIMMSVYFGWQYAIIFNLKEKMPHEAHLPYGRIKTFFYIPIIYIAITIFLMISVAAKGHFFFEIAPGTMALIAPFHLLAMFGIFHTMYFAGKTIKCVETQRNQSFGDFAGEFFLIWFNVIGIWFLQPRLNNIISNDTVYSNDLLDDDVF